MPMIVEFLGIPGAGKTTLVPAVTQCLQDRGLTAMPVAEAGPSYAKRTCLGRIICALIHSSSWQRSALWRVFSTSTIPYRLGFALENAALVRHVVASQLRRPIPWQHRRLVLYWFLRTMGYYQFLKRYSSPDEIIVFDEGFSHRVTHLYVSELEQPDPAHVVEYLRLLPRSDLVILVKAALSTCVERTCARGRGGRLRGKSRQEVTRFIANAEQVVNIASQTLRDTGMEVIEIENNGDLGACTADLCSNVDQFLENQRVLRGE